MSSLIIFQFRHVKYPGESRAFSERFRIEKTLVTTRDVYLKKNILEKMSLFKKRNSKYRRMCRLDISDIRHPALFAEIRR